MELIEYPDSEMMMLSLANLIADDLSEALQQGGVVSLAVPGGTTPGPVFDALAQNSLEWGRVQVVLSDERWVPESDPRSNTALLRRRLLIGPAAQARLLPLYAPGQSADEALPALEAGLAPALPLTVALLGMGADMHTASIFPGADRLTDALEGEGTLYPMRAPGAPERRITLSAKVLRAALHRHILIVGAEKREALEQARTLPPHKAPVAALLPGTKVHWAAS